MNEKDLSGKIRNAFEEVKPSPELIARLSEEKIHVRKRRKPVLKVFLVAAAIFLIGSAGVYAASEISFKDVFGDYIYVSDKELADGLMGKVHKFKYSVSDDAYAIRIIGITGDRKNMIFKAEIYRKDGTPVTDYFRNLPDENEEGSNMLYMPEEHYVVFSNCSSGWGSVLNDAGNIEIQYEMNSGKSSMKGKRFYAEGADIYPFTKCRNFEVENDVYISYSLHRHEKKISNMLKPNEKSDISDEEIIGLNLDWAFSFRYSPSEKSEIKKVCSNINEDFELNNNIIIFSPGENSKEDSEGIIRAFTCTPSKIEFTSVGGEMTYSYISEEYNNIEESIIKTVPRSENDMYIVNEDGSRTDIYFSEKSEKISGDVCTVDTGIEYIEYTGERSEEYSHIFADASKFKELHINGTVYQLK